MTLDRSKSQNRQKSASAGNAVGTGKSDYAALSPGRKKKESIDSAPLQTFSSKKKTTENNFVKVENSEFEETQKFSAGVAVKSKEAEKELIEKELSYAEQQKLAKQEKKKLRDKLALSGDNWLVRNGHAITYCFLFLFSVFVFFRPYELIPQLAALQSGAFILALATLAIYLPTQFITEGSLTMLTTEVKAVLALVGIALITMPVSVDFSTAWTVFNDIFIKAVLVFIVMVNVVRTRRRLLGIIWISFGISIYLSYTALGMFARGELKGDGYRVINELGGMLNNPNDWALHLVMMIPLAIALGIATKNYLMRIVYFAMAGLFVAAITVTFSRGGFLGLIAAFIVFVWKIGRRNRVKSIAIASAVAILFILLAPGNYGLRLLSIFVPGFGDNGSSDQRKENLIISLIVTAKHPWGIGIGCSPYFGVDNLQTHNAYTQVSSELGLAGFAAYLTFIISPFKKLAAIERTLFEKSEGGWLYYMAIGLQASFAGYMVSSFFGSVAYNWFIYYMAAYAVSFRRIYWSETGKLESSELKNKI